MSLALYRKYRPGTFAEVKGQEHVTDPLRQALSTGRINHAYLFSGPRGCGKTSSARILARSLNCEKGPTPDPCGECESCVALAPTGAGHLDVIEIDAASHGGVDDARDLRERAFFAPVSARFKIYIIDEAHMVTREGFNALLKLVEEPPPHLKFVFATTEPEKVIGTIKSRTHHYPFRLMPPGTLRGLLEEILRSESVPYEAAALPLVVRAGAGSARDSLSILDQLLAGADDAGITYARAVSLLGYTDGDLLDEMIAAFAARDGGRVFGAVHRVIEGGHDPRRFAMDLLERFRDLVVLANVPDAAGSGLLDRPGDELERLAAQAASMGPAELTRAAEVFNSGLTEMRGATSPRLLLELMCARVLLPGAAQGESALLARLERLERGGVAAATPRAASPVAGDAGLAQPQAATVVRPQEVTVPPPPARTGGAEPAASVAEPRAETDASRAGDWPAATRAGAQARPDDVPAAAPARAGTGGGAVQQAWPQVLEALRQRSPAVWSNVNTHARVAGVEGDLVTLAYTQVGAQRYFVNGGKDSVVATVLGEVLGGTWRVEAVLGNGGGAAPAPAAPAQAVRQPRPAPAPQPQRAAPAPVRTQAPPPVDESWPDAPSDDEGPGPAAGSGFTAAQAVQSRPRKTGAAGWPDAVPGRSTATGAETDDADPDADTDTGHLSGMALVQRELGGTIIDEVD
ncbi:DNA polymerase III subunit gamma and tau [Sphaerisporangium rubeum]|uniref:DNA polymerase III subunit gamma/tau n=1 Tax=Sphaerisporangium rubeum TaxID=321317 RepID=A0A7X0IB26_9ACTN|nr:DNA polymerase III subunit gamma and tau [Sphaerisporangium rubeum]MBB6470668.1 DNA polymerase-3 subunit gamma/tau [Sphaerisporangium rubeum]